MMLIRVRFLEVFEAISIVFISLHARHVADTAVPCLFQRHVAAYGSKHQVTPCGVPVPDSPPLRSSKTR